MTPYLTGEERRALRDDIINLTGGDYQTHRPALLAGLPPRARIILPAIPQNVGVQLTSDLVVFSETMRISGGVVPLAVFLEELLDHFSTGDPALLDNARALLARVQGRAVGAPDVAPPTTTEVKEAIVHQNDLLPFSFIRGAQAAAAAVARLQVPRIVNGNEVKGADGLPMLFYGTGWLVGDGLLLTNHHVINARLKGEPVAEDTDLKLQVAGMKVLFDYDEENISGGLADVGELVAADPVLDFALVQVATDRRPVNVSLDLPVAPDGHGAAALNIIQHPGGNPKAFGIRNNLMASSNDTELRYFTDTSAGSSGAPVFDDQWQAVALHRGHRYAPGVQFHGADAVYVNLGTRLSAIAEHLRPILGAGQLPQLGI